MPGVALLKLQLASDPSYRSTDGFGNASATAVGYLNDVLDTTVRTKLEPVTIAGVL